MFSAGFFILLSGMLGAQAGEIVVSVDRTTQAWSDLAMGPPSADDDADQSQNQNVVFSYVPGFGKPHADAGARGLHLPRLNDGKFAATSEDPANSTWFDTKGNSRILVDLGRRMDVARINVYSWHSGALSPQRYTLWASEAESAPSAEAADLSKNWSEVARGDTFLLGEGGKHGSSINSPNGVVGSYRYLLFDLSANKPEWSRSGFISEIDVYAVGRRLQDIVTVKREPGSQHLRFGDIFLTKPLRDETPFLIAGPRLYEFGAMDGTFPRVGRLDGDQGGVWCHPIKLVETFGFDILEADRKPWHLLGPSRFEHDFASASFHFERNDLKATRRDFAPEDEPALVSLLTLRNNTDRLRELVVRFSAAVNLRPSYESRLPNGPDVIEYQEGLLGGSDSAMAGKWGVVLGSDQSPMDHGIAGTNGFLSYRVSLPAKAETTLEFLIVGEHLVGVEGARARFRSIASRTAELLAAKQVLYRERILGGVKFECSDPVMNEAFLFAKANAMMSVMDLRPNYQAPFLAAGFPIYTWLFGCDSLHSTAGIVAAGFDDAARGTLECLLHFAGEHKLGAHEVTSNGRLLGWDHIQETPQLVAACWQFFQWTGDHAFLTKAYPICREIVSNALATADQDRDGYLEGPGLMEQPGMGPERIDSVCQLYAAYVGLAGMSEALEKSGAEEFRGRAAGLSGISIATGGTRWRRCGRARSKGMASRPWTTSGPWSSRSRSASRNPTRPRWPWTEFRRNGSTISGDSSISGNRGSPEKASASSTTTSWRRRHLRMAGPTSAGGSCSCPRRHLARNECWAPSTKPSRGVAISCNFGLSDRSSSASLKGWPGFSPKADRTASTCSLNSRAIWSGSKSPTAGSVHTA